jgi:AcrR family transcriptional regulator
VAKTPSPTARRRSARDRLVKEPLSRKLIVDTALGILRAEGLDAVTMRRVATALETGPASLYVYVQGSDGLRTAMLDSILEGITLEEPDPRRWRQQVHSQLHAMLEVMEAHNGIAAVAVAKPPTDRQALLFAENLMGLLLAGGIAPRDAGLACDLLPQIATTAAVERAIWSSRAVDAGNEATVSHHLYELFSSLPPEQFPNLTSNVGALTDGDADMRFRFAVDTILDGLAARATAEPRHNARTE